MRLATTVRIAVTGVGLLLVAISCAPAASVVINGQQLVTSRSPLTLGGSMLLPMRDVFEALHAQIKWFAAQQQIIAIRGDTTIQLTIGSRVAKVNEATIQLPVAPMLVGGSTYVPLRFPAEAFGGTVRWDGATQTAFIDIPEGGGPPPEPEPGPAVVVPPTPTEPAQPVEPPTAPQPVPPPEPATIEGTLVQVYKAAAPGVVVQLSGTDAIELLKLGANTVLTRGPHGAAGQPATVDDLQVGDLLQGKADDKNVFLELAASYGEKQGKVVALAGNTLVFEDGTALTLSSNVQVLDPSGAPTALSAVTVGVQAVARYQPMTKTVWRIQLPTPPPPPPPAQAEKVEILTIGLTNPGTVFKAGDMLTIRLQGTPLGQATANISGRVAGSVALAEIEPGVYQADYSVPAGVEAKNAKLTGNLVKGGKKARPVVSPAALTVDSTPPTVPGVLPADGASTENKSPTIQADYDDGDGSGVDLNSLQLTLDGQDVTNATTIGAAGATYTTQNLRLGAHQVEVVVSDLAGNEVTATWNFTVTAPAQGVIMSVSHDATGVLQKGQTLAVTARVVEGGGPATFSIGTWKTNLPMKRAGSSLNYRGTYKVAAGDQIVDAPVTVKYRSPAGLQATMIATNPVTMDATLPTELRITAPADGSAAADQIQVTGVAPPNSQVRVTITFKTKLITTVSGQLSQDTVRADEAGNWQTPAVSAEVFLGKANEYGILAELLDAEGQPVATQAIKLTK